MSNPFSIFLVVGTITLGSYMIYSQYDKYSQEPKNVDEIAAILASNKAGNTSPKQSASAAENAETNRSADCDSEKLQSESAEHAATVAQLGESVKTDCVGSETDAMPVQDAAAK